MSNRARLHDRVGQYRPLYYINPFTREVVSMRLYSLQADRHLEALRGQGVVDMFSPIPDQPEFNRRQLERLEEKSKIVLDKRY